MSSYTVELRFIIRDNIEMLDNALSQYPIYDESFRNVLNARIKEHFYTSEIGFETEFYFCNRLDNKLKNIMPYYNQLFLSEQIKIDPLININLTTKADREVDNKSKTDFENTQDNENTQNSTGNNTSKTKFESIISNKTTEQLSGDDNTAKTGSDTTDNINMRIRNDTPMGDTQGSFNADGLLSFKFASETEQNKGQNKISYANNSKLTHGRKSTTDVSGGDENTTDFQNNYNDNITTAQTDIQSGLSNFNGNTIDDYLQHVTGYNGNQSMSTALIEYRKTFLNIIMLILDELQPLFMSIW